MPFYNFTSEEASSIRDFTARRGTRRTMTFVGGRSGPVQDSTEEMDEESSELSTPYIDNVVRVVEAVLLRHALSCVSPPSPEVSANATSPAVPASSLSGERPYPFPSLFLHTPPQLVALQAAVAGSPNSANNFAEVHDTPYLPPADLLYTEAKSAVKVSGEVGDGGGAARAMVAAPLPYDTAHTFPEELRRHAAVVQTNASLDAARRMVNVTLTPALSDVNRTTATSCQQLVQVVLQAEAGLVVAFPPFLPPPSSAPQQQQQQQQQIPERLRHLPWRTPPQKNDDAAAAAAEAPFLFSPDATSCVIVACRVTLHPRLQQALTPLDIAALSPSSALSDVASSVSCEVAACATFLHACARTATACMVHLDRPDGIAAMLRELVWDGAVPAFFHAVHQHYRTHILNSAESTSSTVGAAVDLLERLLSALSDGHNSSSPAAPSSTSSAPSTFLHVDWYVVGGIRMKKCAAPVVEAVFRAFFPPSLSSESDSSAADTGNALLKERVPLSSLVADATGSTVAVAVAHRLREDGQCFWSFNTTFQPWCVDPKPTQRYAFPMTWGLLLSVSTGHSWPATVQPGTRMVPFSEVRSVATQHGYRWITPLESDSLNDTTTTTTKNEEEKEEEENNGQEVAGLRVVHNAVPSATVVQRVEKVVAPPTLPPELRLWSALQPTSSSSSSASGSEGNTTDADARVASSPADTVRLSLASYVCTVLARQREWWQRRMARSAPPSPATPLPNPLPLLIRSRYQSSSSRSSAAHTNSVSKKVTWDCVPLDRVMAVLAQPKVYFLNSSTTPHCEPPDFADGARNKLLWLTSVASSDVFVDGTDGLYID